MTILNMRYEYYLIFESNFVGAFSFIEENPKMSDDVTFSID